MHYITYSIFCIFVYITGGYIKRELHNTTYNDINIVLYYPRSEKNYFN